MLPRCLAVLGLLAAAGACRRPDGPTLSGPADATPENADTGPAAPESGDAGLATDAPPAEAPPQPEDAGPDGPPPTVLITGIDPNGVLVAADGFLYFGDASFPEELKRIPLAGAREAERAVIANPVAMFVAGNLLYVLDRGLSGGQVGRIGGRLFQAPLGALAPLADTDLAEDELEPHQLVLEGGHLYWSIKPGTTSSLRRVAAGGGPAETLLTHDRGRSLGLAVVGDELFFATGCCVASLPKQGGADPVMRVTQQEPPIRAFAATPDGIYLLVGSGGDRDGALLRFSLRGEPRPPLATGIADPGQLLLGEGTVVWSDRGTRQFTLPAPVFRGGAVYRTSIERGETAVLVGEVVNLTGFSLAGDRLYYATGTTQLRPPLDGKLLVVDLR